MWDKYGACTNFVAVEYDRTFVNVLGNVEPKFKVLFRVEIPKSKFTYVNAVNKIIELNDVWDFDYIAIDRGYGEVQIELLHKYGAENPHTGLQDKVVGYHFAQNLMVYDPFTRQKEGKPLKPFMVNNSVIVFENKKIVLNPDDKQLIEDIEGYRLKGRSKNGAPIYSDENEHTIDCINLCLLIFEQNHGALFKDLITTRMYPIDGINLDRTKMTSRDFNLNKQSTLIKKINDNKVIKFIDKKAKPRRNTITSRRLL